MANSIFAALGLEDHVDEPIVEEPVIEPVENEEIVEDLPSSEELDKPQIEISEATSDLNDLGDMQVAMEDAINRRGGLSPEAGKLASNIIASIDSRYRFKVAPAPSMEDYEGGRHRLMTQISMEGVKERIQQLWEWLKKKMKALKDWIVGLYRKAKAFFDKAKENAEQAKEKAKKGQKTKGPISLPAAPFLIDGRVIKPNEMVKAIEDLQKMIDVYKKDSVRIFTHVLQQCYKKMQQLSEVSTDTPIAQELGNVYIEAFGTAAPNLAGPGASKKPFDSGTVAGSKPLVGNVEINVTWPTKEIIADNIMSYLGKCDISIEVGTISKDLTTVDFEPLDASLGIPLAEAISKLADSTNNVADLNRLFDRREELMSSYQSTLTKLVQGKGFESPLGTPEFVLIMTTLNHRLSKYETDLLNLLKRLVTAYTTLLNKSYELTQGATSAKEEPNQA